MSAAKAKPLPTKLSGLLRLAVKDAKKVAKTKGYKLDMSEWHTPNGVCKVCMAGAVIAMERKPPRTKLVEPYGNYVSYDEMKAMFAINEMRSGYFKDAAVTMQVAISDKVADAAQKAVGKRREHLDGGRAPWNNYLKAARILEKAGL